MQALHEHSLAGLHLQQCELLCASTGSAFLAGKVSCRNCTWDARNCIMTHLKPITTNRDSVKGMCSADRECLGGLQRPAPIVGKGAVGVAQAQLTTRPNALCFSFCAFSKLPSACQICAHRVKGPPHIPVRNTVHYINIAYRSV